jgi:hypothetical protein
MTAEPKLSEIMKEMSETLLRETKEVPSSEAAHVPAARTQRPGLPEFVFPSGSERPSDPLPPAGRSSGNQSRLIPAMPPCDRLDAGTGPK